jgi:hypothetical protein
MMAEALSNPDESNILKIKSIQEDYRKVFSTEEGKRVLTHMEQIGFFKTTTFLNDAISMAFNEGNRAFLLHIKTILDMDIETLEKIYAAQGGK